MSNESITKSIHCYSYEYLVFNKKKLRGYNQTRKLYDPDNEYDNADLNKGGLLNLLFKNLYYTWSISYINPIYLNVFHTFDFADSTYTEVFDELQKGYNCVFIFDNVNQTVGVYTNEEIGVNTGLVLSDQNYIKSISNEDKFDEIKSRLYVYGKDNISINRYNPTGLSYVESYDFFINNGYFSSSLATAWNNYKVLIVSKQGQFDGYITQLETYEASLLLKQNELAALNAEKLLIEDALDLEKSNPTNTFTYDDIYDDLQAKEAEIEDKEDEINSIQSNINSVNANIITLQNTLSYTNNFSTENLQELVNFVFEDTLNMSQVSDSEQLYTYGLAYLEKISTVPLTFDVDNIDVFSTQEGQLDWNKINIGDYINIDCPELGFDYYPIRLVGFNHNPVSNSLSMTFSNTDKIESDILYLNDIFKLSNKVAVEVEVKKYEYERYSNDSDRVLYSDSTISNNIQLGNNFINRRGFIGSDIGSLSGSKIQVFNDKICITTDNWETYHTLISGNGVFLQTDTSQTIMHKDYGFAINVWNPALNDYYNSIYIGLDPSNNPAIFVDNGYISLTRIVDNIERNRIYLDPSVGIKIQSKDDVNWIDRFWVDVNGNLIAKQLRTSSDSNDFITLEEQWISFYNGTPSLEKMKIGVVDFGSENYNPFIQLGAGDSGDSTRNIFEIRKDSTYLNMIFSNSDGGQSGIGFLNSNYDGYPDGALALSTDGDMEITIAGDLIINGSIAVTDSITIDSTTLTFERGILVNVT
ncbi:MAG: phage tail protein [Tissierellia bacterium]|nr:phage tail protein [Tissierellia bacterium]